MKKQNKKSQENKNQSKNVEEIGGVKWLVVVDENGNKQYLMLD